MTALVTALCFVVYLAGYRLYAGWLARRVFAIDPARPTPAHTLRDDVDYVPSRRGVLFGHHYASITGLSPMLGPAVAVIWGWAPAMAWVVLGGLLIGCVHDFGALVVSMRARGSSIGKLTEGIVGTRAKMLFHLIIFFGIALAMGVFVYVIAVMFAITPAWDPGRPLADPSSFPTAVLPSAALMLIALAVGYLSHRRGVRLGRLAAGGFALLLAGVWAGLEWPLLGLTREAWPAQPSWVVMLLAYSFLASVLPVWSLLQSRDFLNSLLLYLGLGLAYLGLFVGAPEFAAPAFRLHPEGAPGFVPFVFIVIACGAVSGFHSLVSSGTTAKQIASEADAKPIGYGGMIGESLLGLLAVVACTAVGVAGQPPDAARAAWLHLYADWGSIQGLGAQVGVFVTGAAHFVERLGFLDFRQATALVAVVVVSFALTTLDSATRLLRFNVTEIGETLGWRFLANRYLASAVAVGVIALFAFYEIGGQPAGLALWRLFGTTNQLLAGLALMTVSLYLLQRGKNAWPTALPALLMLLTTVVAMLINLADFWQRRAEGTWVLFAVGLVLLVLALWLLVEAVVCLRRQRGRAVVESMEVPVGEGGPR
jgi:carbon starvation protein